MNRVSHPVPDPKVLVRHFDMGSRSLASLVSRALSSPAPHGRAVKRTTKHPCCVVHLTDPICLPTRRLFRCIKLQSLIGRLDQALKDMAEQQRRFAQTKRTLLAEKTMEVNALATPYRALPQPRKKKYTRPKSLLFSLLAAAASPT